jgi:hypothetical protein
MFLSLHSGSSCLTDASTRPVGSTGDTTLTSFQNSGATWTGGVVLISLAAAEGPGCAVVRRPGSAPLSWMPRSRADHRHRGSDGAHGKGYGDVPGLHMSMDLIAWRGEGEGGSVADG